MSKKSQKMTYSIRTAIVSVLIFAFLLIASMTIALQYYFNQSVVQTSTAQLYQSETNRVRDYINQNDQTAANYSTLLANFNNLVEEQKISHDALQLFANVMQKNESYRSISLAFANGDLQQLVSLNKQRVNPPSLQTEDSDRWVFISVSNQDNQGLRQIFYFDQAFTLRAQHQEETNVDASKLTWYQNAETLKVKRSAAYIISQSPILGQTYSVKVPDTDVVLSIETTLSSLSDILNKHSQNKQNYASNELYLYQGNGSIITSNQTHSELKNNNQLPLLPYPILTELTQQPVNFHKLNPISLNHKKYHLYLAPLNANYNDKQSNTDIKNRYLAILVPNDILFAESIKQLKMSFIILVVCLIILLPILWLLSSSLIRPIKALIVEIDKVKQGNKQQLQPISSQIEEIQQLNDSMVNMTQSIEVHQTAQKQWMESFIKCIAQTIDNKSPYTAGHCNRIPELSLMLADAIDQSNLPAFKEFKFNNVDEHREFRIAAWLHDCGKITTPQHIVDKGTKLEANYNRIHEIRARFEILWRDAEISYYQQSRVAPEQNKPLKEALIKQQLQLMRDFEFIAKSNIGDQLMTEKDIIRLQTIGEQTWLRYFDDRLGLSPNEELNLLEKKQKLPAKERLLNNKKEHLIKRDHHAEFTSKSAIKMEIPEYQYNLGELYNLSIDQGTLTSEDKFKINQHIISTIHILESLPFPAELANVPRYASAHFERLTGTAYPHKLSANDLSIPERILVIADLFEALTASDKPYKKAKPINIAIDILHQMALDQYIDMDIFKLFLTSGIYLQYANKFLDKKQLNAVDISKYLA